MTQGGAESYSLGQPWTERDEFKRELELLRDAADAAMRRPSSRHGQNSTVRDMAKEYLKFLEQDPEAKARFWRK